MPTMEAGRREYTVLTQETTEVTDEQWRDLSQRLNGAKKFRTEYLGWEYLKERYGEGHACVVMDDDGTNVIGFGMLRAMGGWYEMGTIYSESSGQGIGTTVVTRLVQIARAENMQVFGITKEDAMAKRFIAARFTGAGADEAEIKTWMSEHNVQHESERTFGDGRKLFVLSSEDEYARMYTNRL